LYYFRSKYAHLNKIFVKPGDKVKRGDPIGNVTEHKDYAKLMLEETANYVNPDYYGFGHGYMDYATKPLEIDAENEANPELIKKKMMKQREIVSKFDRSRIGWDKHFLFEHYHRGEPRKCSWSTVEQFRYLKNLYEIKPDLFPSLSNDEFQSLKKHFYDNQPIILTLPLVKGGMKRYK